MDSSYSYHDRKEAVSSPSVLILPLDRLRYLPAPAALLTTTHPDEVGVASVLHYAPFSTEPDEELTVTAYTLQALVSAWRRYLEMAAADRDADFGRPPISLADMKAVMESEDVVRATMFKPTHSRPLPPLPPIILSPEARRAQELRSVMNEEEEEKDQLAVLIPDAWPTTPAIERGIRLAIERIRPEWGTAVVESVYTPPEAMTQLHSEEASLEYALETAQTREEYKGICARLDRLWIEEIAPLEQDLIASRKLAVDLGPDYDREFENARRQAVWSGQKPLPSATSDGFPRLNAALLELEIGMADPETTLADLKAQIPWADDFPELPIREAVESLSRAIRGDTVKPWRH